MASFLLNENQMIAHKRTKSLFNLVLLCFLMIGLICAGVAIEKATTNNHNLGWFAVIFCDAVGVFYIAVKGFNAFGDVVHNKLNKTQRDWRYWTKLAGVMAIWIPAMSAAFYAYRMLLF